MFGVFCFVLAGLREISFLRENLAKFFDSITQKSLKIQHFWQHVRSDNDVQVLDNLRYNTTPSIDYRPYEPIQYDRSSRIRMNLSSMIVVAESYACGAHHAPAGLVLVLLRKLSQVLVLKKLYSFTKTV